MLFSPCAVYLWKESLLTVKLVTKISVDQKLLHVNSILFLLWWMEISVSPLIFAFLLSRYETRKKCK